jgi:hypothetical protein
MKKNEIKKIIKMDMTSRIPNVISKIDLSQIEFEQQETTYPLKAAKPFKLVYMMTSLLLIMVAITVVSVTLFNPLNHQIIMFQDDDEIHIFSAFSAASLLEQSSQNVSLSQNTLYFELGHYDILDAINAYLPFVEILMMPNRKMTSEVIEDQQHIIFSGSDLRKKQVSYQMSFPVNDTSVANLRLNNQDFIIETNSSEKHKDVFIVRRNHVSEHSYVVVEHQKTRKEQVFKYSLYFANALVFKSEIHFEKTDQNTSAIVISHQANEQVIDFRITKRTSSFTNVLDISYGLKGESSVSENLSVRVIFDREINAHMYLYQFTDINGQRLIEKNRLLSN